MGFYPSCTRTWVYTLYIYHTNPHIYLSYSLPEEHVAVTADGDELEFRIEALGHALERTLAVQVTVCAPGWWGWHTTT